MLEFRPNFSPHSHLETRRSLGRSHGGPGDCQAARELAQAKVTQLADTIAGMQRMRRLLAELIATCERPRTDRCCSLIQTFGAEGENR